MLFSKILTKTIYYIGWQIQLEKQMIMLNEVGFKWSWLTKEIGTNR